ncbi:MAG TPA: hypothetical protein VG408_09010, partial [Actinomycetota bacterium]|nr:hypothetical protein [Actinomycetota bacterium]
ATAEGTTSAESVTKTAAASSVTTARPVPAKAVDVEPSLAAPEKADVEPSPPVPENVAAVETAAPAPKETAPVEPSRPVPKEAPHAQPSRSVPKKVPPEVTPRPAPKKVPPEVTPRPAPKKPVVDVRAAARKPASRGKVVAVPHTKRFHKPTCRYASTKNAVEITKTTAVARGFEACGVCKP